MDCVRRATRGRQLETESVLIRNLHSNTKYFYSQSHLSTLSNMISQEISFALISKSRCVRLTTLPPSCADCLEILEPQPPGTLRACPGL
jgi:hypothetical protein